LTVSWLTFGRATVYGVLVFWSFVCVFPLYWLLVNSLKSVNAVAQGPYYLPFIDFTPQLYAWRFILSNGQDKLSWQLFNSVSISLAATLLTVICASLATYGLTRFMFAWPRSLRGGNANNVIWFVLLASRILPPVAILVPVHLMAVRYGFLETRWLLVLLYAAANLPVAMWLLRPIFGERASDQEEAAWLEGAGHGEIFFSIVAPMLLRGIVTVGFLVFLLCWSEYFYAANLGGEKAMTLPPWIVAQVSMREAQIIAEEDEISHLSAAIILMVVPLLAVAGWVQSALRGPRFGARPTQL
jgi:multiple sugar transport system permease protein